MQMSDMDVASPSKQSDTGHASTPKKNRDKRTSAAPAPADIPPKTPNTETKKIYRTSLVVGPRTREGYATLEEVCENIKRKLLGCAAIHEKMRGPAIELTKNGMQKITLDSKDDTEFKAAAKEAGLALLSEGLNECKLMVITPKDANVSALVGAWAQAVDVWQLGQQLMKQMKNDGAALEDAYVAMFSGNAEDIGRMTYERSTDRLKDHIKESKDGMAIGFAEKEAFQKVIGAMQHIWQDGSASGDQEAFNKAMINEMKKTMGITGPGKEDGWFIVLNDKAGPEITANGMSAMGGTKWGHKGEFISTEELTINLEAFISPTRGVHSIKAGFREGAPGFEAICTELGDGIITMYPRTDEHTESQYIIKVLLKIPLIKQAALAGKLAMLCNDARNDSKISKGVTTPTSFGDVTLIWSGDLSKARERNGLHPVMATTVEGAVDTKELEKKNEELVKTVKTLENRLAVTDGSVRAIMQSHKTLMEEQAKAITELTKMTLLNEEKSQKKIDMMQNQMAMQQQEFLEKQAMLQDAQLAAHQINEEFKQQIAQMMMGINKSIQLQTQKQETHDRQILAIKELVPFVDPGSQTSGDKRRKPASPLRGSSAKEGEMQEEEDEDDEEEGEKCVRTLRSHAARAPSPTLPTSQERKKFSSEASTESVEPGTGLKCDKGHHTRGDIENQGEYIPAQATGARTKSVGVCEGTWFRNSKVEATSSVSAYGVDPTRMRNMESKVQTMSLEWKQNQPITRKRCDGGRNFERCVDQRNLRSARASASLLAQARWKHGPCANSKDAWARCLLALFIGHTSAAVGSDIWDDGNQVDLIDHLEVNWHERRRKHVSKGAAEEAYRTRLRWYLTRRAWKRFMRALRGNTVELKLKVSVWNARQLNAEQTSDNSVSLEKMKWLKLRLDGEAPDICFLLELTGTRDNFTEQRKGLRAQMHDVGYTTHWIVGEGGSSRERTGSDTHTNGIAILTRRSTCKLVSYQRLEERLLGATVQTTGANPLHLRVAAIHGLHDEGSSSFQKQMMAASDWAKKDNGQGAGALLVGDFNYVADISWRSSTAPLSPNDKFLRGFITGASPIAEYVSDQVGQSNYVTWTRRPGAFGANIGNREGEGAMLDGAMAFGVEIHKWRRSAVDFARKDHGEALSDHAWLSFQREIPTMKMQSEPRPKSALPRQDAQVKNRYKELVRSGDVALALQESARRKEEALRAGNPDGIFATKEAVDKLRSVAQAATGQICEQRKEKPKEASHRWRSWLREAYSLRSSNTDPHAIRGGLFMAHTGLGAIRNRYSKLDTKQIWDKIIKRCQRQLNRAKGKLIRKQQREDERIKELSLGIISGKKGADAMRQAMDAWRAIKKPIEHIAFESYFPNDDISATPVKSNDPNFIAGLAKEGERMVKGFASTPPIIEAFQAFCKVFCPTYETLRGKDGGQWELLNELTYPVFLEVLDRVPKGKAVGAGGFSIELLINADEEVKQAFFNCLIADLKGEVYPPEWKRVIYVLLVKPAPSNASLISERREIALMAQDMKLIMHMVRATAYRRITGRLRLEQCGWLPGYGTIDSGLPLAVVIQQAKRLRHSLWILYIDLATFFPRIDREVLTVAELLVGLPQPVIDLVSKIYGAGRASAIHAVECQFDSSVGLGETFKNYMGALMGEVLSPDRAKIMLNSILCAIKLFVHGVPLFGFKENSDGYIRTLAQMAYADDWAGTFNSEADLRRAWALWETWVPISGSKIGIKCKLKTVLTGVIRNEKGEERDISDPGLTTLDGTRVPVMSMGEAYKHLGVLRAACGHELAAEEALKKQLRAAIARIKRMYKPRVEDIVLVSNGLFQGLAGFKCSTAYYSFEFMESIEKEWRRVFNKKTKRDESTPVCLLYEGGGGTEAEGNKRRHLWTISCTALYVSFSRAMADAADTSQRAAARSSLALSMSRWGCQGDPQIYQWGHMLAAMEQTLKGENTRYLGDAFMLIAGLLKAYKPEGTSDCNWICTTPLPRDDPLHHRRSYFRETESLALFEPENSHGLGIEVAPTLLEARIRAAGQMACSGVDGPRWMTFKEAQACYQHLPNKAEAEWNRTVAALDEGGLSGVFPEREVKEIWGQRNLRAVNGDVQLSETRGKETRLGVEALDELRTAIRESVDRRKRGLPADGDVDWEGAIRRAFPGTVEPVAEEWALGGADVVADASGGRLFFESDECTRFLGGEASWMKLEQVDQHGFLVDWQGRVEEMRRGFSFDSQGFLCHSSCGRIIEDDLGKLEPAVQMVARARLALGDVPVLEGDGNKRQETHVQLRAQYRMWTNITAWAARIRATKVLTLDGSRRMVPTGEGGWMPICTRAAVDHEGNIVGGRFTQEVGVAEDNYHAELAAQLDALHEATRNLGERVIIIFDATSPVLAMLRFGRLGARARGDKLAAELLEHFERLRRRCAALVLLWQTSHVGEPINEYADITCDKFGLEDLCPIQRGEVQFASITFPGHVRSAQEFAIKGMGALVASRLRQRVQRTVLREPDEHVALFKLTEEAAAFCEAIGARRCQYVDQPYPGRRASLLIKAEACPFGCLKHERRWREVHPAAALTKTKICLPSLAEHLHQQMGVGPGDTVVLSERMEARLQADKMTHTHAVQARSGRWFIRDAHEPSWWHFHFECMGITMVTARKHYALQAVKARSCLLKSIGPDAAGRGQGHGQLNDLIVLLHQGLGGWEAEDGAAGSVANQGYIRERARRGEIDGWLRAAAGILDRTGNQADNSSKFRMAITDMVVAGCALGLRVGHFVRDQGGFFYAPGEVASNNTLSGGVAPEQGEQIEIEIEPRRGPVQNKARRKAVHKERRERQRRVVMRAVYDGLEPDDAGRWAIQRILQVVRPATSRRGRPLQVLVQWVGDDEDGNPWQDSWVGITRLTADQRAEARRLEKARYAPEDLGKKARKEVVAQRRAQQPQDKDKKQWEVRLRNRKRAREGVEMG